jgi:hypothetical protein
MLIRLLPMTRRIQSVSKINPQGRFGSWRKRNRTDVHATLAVLG